MTITRGEHGLKFLHKRGGESLIQVPQMSFSMHGGIISGGKAIAYYTHLIQPVTQRKKRLVIESRRSRPGIRIVERD